MNIHNLNRSILLANEKKNGWKEKDFLFVLTKISENSPYAYDWDYGENWARFFDNSSVVLMLCYNIPFALSNKIQLINQLQLFPKIEAIKITNFNEDKIIVSKEYQKLIEPFSRSIDSPSSILDFYVATV